MYYFGKKVFAKNLIKRNKQWKILKMSSGPTILPMENLFISSLKKSKKCFEQMRIFKCISLAES